MEAPHHDALTHQALRGIALMSTESIQPNCSNNAAWNDPSAGMGLRLLALLGSVVLTLFNPQVRIDRRGFAIGLVGWLLAAAAAYALMDPIADAAWISDSAILVIAKIYGWAAGLWSIGVTVLCARRAHDCGFRAPGHCCSLQPGSISSFCLHASACRGAQRAWHGPGPMMRPNFFTARIKRSAGTNNHPNEGRCGKIAHCTSFFLFERQTQWLMQSARACW